MVFFFEFELQDFSKQAFFDVLADDNSVGVWGEYLGDGRENEDEYGFVYLSCVGESEEDFEVLFFHFDDFFGVLVEVAQKWHDEVDCEVAFVDYFLYDFDFFFVFFC